jgi:excisionase family DNA binding protein
MSIESEIEVLVRSIVREELTSFARTFAKETASQQYVTIQQYAAARSISVSTVRNAVRAGKLPALRIGKAVRVQSDAEIGAVVHPDAKPEAKPEYSASEIADLILAKIPRKQWSEYPPGFVKRLLAVESPGSPTRVDLRRPS